jgi:ADP-ribosylglycohydrolase
LNVSPVERAIVSLEGLALGDMFGQCFFVHPDVVDGLIAERALPKPPWYYTDDTEMALSIVAMLRAHGRINQDTLARSFAEHYNYNRGYGPAMHGMLDRIREGESWRIAARTLFKGQGSYGNGAAMRVAPLGAYFADNLEMVVQEAIRSAEVTHAHPEGIAGAVAVAIGAALATRMAIFGAQATPQGFLEQILPHVPESVVRERIRHARNLAPESSMRLAVAALGNGSGISAQDTVPFALWCAAQHLGNYEEAMWLTVSGLGDRDTTCAIAGGIVALSASASSLPAEWLACREPLPAWFQ